MGRREFGHELGERYYLLSGIFHIELASGVNNRYWRYCERQWKFSERAQKPRLCTVNSKQVHASHGLAVD